MIKAGTWTEINQEANKILKEKYQEAGIEECEIKIPGKCWRNKFLGFAHRFKRSYYKDHPDQLSEMSHTVLACTPCHQAIEYDEKLTLAVFKKLRPQKFTNSAVENITMKSNKPKAMATKAKKADWMRQHACIHCHKPTSMLICEKCGELSIKK